MSAAAGAIGVILIGVVLNVFVGVYLKFSKRWETK